MPPAPAVFSRCSWQPSLSASASAIDSPARSIALADVAGLGRAGVQDHAARADRIADPQRMGQRGERLGADLGIIAGAVEQVDGVDQDRIDRARGHRLPEGREVLVAVGRRAPHARRLVEDLDRRQPRSMPRSIARQAAGGGDVGSD